MAKLSIEHTWLLNNKMTITVEGLTQLDAKFTSIAAFNQWARQPVADTLNDLWDNIAKYKPKAQGAFSAMATPKQKRAYWARVRSGAINHGANGYVRSGTLGRSWTMRLTTRADGLRGEIGNNVGYARYVQSARQQQPFHAATGFQTDTGAIKDTEPKRAMIWRAAIRALLR